jgi:L-iditol 2-dehydrogenase
MKAAVFQGPRRVEIQERPVPGIRDDEVLLRVRASGICGSDVHGFEGRIPDRRPAGLVMGHEACGEVADAGARVTRFKAGDRVAVNPLIPCGACDACAHGWFHMCDAMVTFGSAIRVFHDGLTAEYAAVPERQLARLPDGVSFQEGAVVEPAGNAVHLLNRAVLETGGSVAVFGTGTIGLLVVQAARMAGARQVIAVEPNPFRREQARAGGADVAVDPRAEDPVAAVLKATGDRGVDVAAETAGFAVTYRACLEVVRKRGKVIAFGFMEPEVTFSLRRIIYREVSIIGSTAFTYEIETALALMAGGRLNVRPLITHTFPLERAQEAYETAADPGSRSIKVLVIP